jgi:hypothetical protein
MYSKLTHTDIMLTTMVDGDSDADSSDDNCHNDNDSDVRERIHNYLSFRAPLL